MSILLMQIGALVPACVVLAIFVGILSRIRRKPNRPLHIIAAAALTFVVLTVIGGFGMQDYGPSPLFVEAGSVNFFPVVVAMCIALVINARTALKRVTGAMTAAE